MKSKMNIFKLSTNVIIDRDTAIRWCITNGLLPDSKLCPLCSSSMIYDISAYSVGRFRCKKRSQHRDRREVEISAGVGTWFAGVKLPIQVNILLMYLFCQGATYQQCIHECNIIDDGTRLSKSSIADMFSFCREVCMIALDTVFGDELIGGPGCIVEIDESKIGKRKYNRGRMVEPGFSV